MRIAKDITWLVGRTPLVELGRFAPGAARLVGKLEALNPTRSNKDRAALAMLHEAARLGHLRPGGTVVECSAGDLGISLAFATAALGYRLILTMPEGAPLARLRLLRALGAEVVLTERARGIGGALAEAESRARAIQDGLCLQPFSNRANARAHERTAQEIWEDTDGRVDTVVCPVGTGGTAAGCIAWFKAQAPHVRVVGVEPAECPVLSGGAARPHGIPGLGAGFVPVILAPGLLAEVIGVGEDEACRAVRELAAREALLVGPASGAVAFAARQVAERLAGRLIVAILPDDGERHAPHAAFDEGPRCGGALSPLEAR